MKAGKAMVKADLTCPHCGEGQEVTIPTDACLHFHKCEHCGEMITPKEEDCCVVCSYSDKKCPVSIKK